MLPVWRFPDKINSQRQSWQKTEFRFPSLGPFLIPPAKAIKARVPAQQPHKQTDKVITLYLKDGGFFSFFYPEWGKEKMCSSAQLKYRISHHFLCFFHLYFSSFWFYPVRHQMRLIVYFQLFWNVPWTVTTHRGNTYTEVCCGIKQIHEITTRIQLTLVQSLSEGEGIHYQHIKTKMSNHI